jgi:hypothetical protein
MYNMKISHDINISYDMNISYGQCAIFSKEIYRYYGSEEIEHPSYSSPQEDFETRRCPFKEVTLEF